MPCPGEQVPCYRASVVNTSILLRCLAFPSQIDDDRPVSATSSTRAPQVVERHDARECVTREEDPVSAEPCRASSARVSLATRSCRGAGGVCRDPVVVGGSRAWPDGDGGSLSVLGLRLPAPPVLAASWGPVERGLRTGPRNYPGAGPETGSGLGPPSAAGIPIVRLSSWRPRERDRSPNQDADAVPGPSARRPRPGSATLRSRRSSSSRAGRSLRLLTRPSKGLVSVCGGRPTLRRGTSPGSTPWRHGDLRPLLFDRGMIRLIDQPLAHRLEFWRRTTAPTAARGFGRTDRASSCP